MRYKNANNALWVEYWAKAVDPKRKYALIQANYSRKKKKWISEAKIPLINKKVFSSANNEIDAIALTVNKVAKIISAYMAEHHELDIENEFENEDYVYVPDSKGNLAVIESKEDLKTMEIKVIR